MSEPTPAEYAEIVLAKLRERGFSDEEIRKGLLEMEGTQ
jgi:hypothetical protein